MAIKEDLEVFIRKGSRFQEPKRYWVIMHNDHQTTQEFVVHVLEDFFHKNSAEAHKLMMTVHLQGQASVGLYSKDVAETKIHQVTQYAIKNSMPLKLSAQVE